MLLLAAVLLGFGFGLFVLHGHPANLARWQFHAVPLAFLGLIVQIVIFSSPWQSRWAASPWTAYAYIGAMALLWLTTLLNLRAPGMPLVSLGIFLNLLVITANGGHMPTLLSNLVAAGHYERLAALQSGQVYTNSMALDNSSQLAFLGDIFVLPSGWPLTKVFSLGDGVIAVGGFVLASGLLRPRRERPTRLAAAVEVAIPQTSTVIIDC